MTKNSFGQCTPPPTSVAAQHGFRSISFCASSLVKLLSNPIHFFLRIIVHLHRLIPGVHDLQGVRRSSMIFSPNDCISQGAPHSPASSAFDVFLIPYLASALPHIISTAVLGTPPPSPESPCVIHPSPSHRQDIFPKYNECHILDDWLDSTMSAWVPGSGEDIAM